jgi:hypothetical protein
VTDEQRTLLTKAVEAHDKANMCLGHDDPYPFDREAHAYYESYLAIGGEKHGNWTFARRALHE